MVHSTFLVFIDYQKAFDRFASFGIDTAPFMWHDQSDCKDLYGSRVWSTTIWWQDLHVMIEKTYTYQTKGTYRDTILTFDYSKLQKLADKKSLDYIFKNEEQFEYEIEYY